MKRFCIETPVLTLKSMIKDFQPVFYQDSDGGSFVSCDVIDEFFELNGNKKISLQITSYSQPQAVTTEVVCKRSGLLLWFMNERLDHYYGSFIPSAMEYLLLHTIPEGIIRIGKEITIYVTVYIHE